MAVTVSDNRTLLDGADSTTGWTSSSGSPALTTSDPDPVEASGHIGLVVSSATVDARVSITSTSFTGKVVYVWALLLGAMDTLANGGAAILVGDGTNRVAYHLAGADVAVFRHNSGQPQYQCLVLDQANLPANKTVRAGSEASLNWGAITEVGAMFKTLAKSKGGVANCFIDILRLHDPVANNGATLSITGGTSGDKGTFEQIATEDALNTDGKAHGVIRKLGAGVFGVQGALRFGNDTGTASSWFEDKNVTVVFEQRNLTTSRYKVFITDNGTGTTTFRLGTKVGSGVTATGEDGVTLLAASGVGWQFDASTDTDVTDVFIYGSNFIGATGGISFRSGHEFIGGMISGSGTITPNGAQMVNTTIVGSTVAVDTSAVVWTPNTDPDGLLDGISISKGTNAHHAIELGVNTPLTMTLRNIDFTGFTNTVGDNAAPLHIKRTSGTVTINLIGTSGITATGYKSDGATVNLIVSPVTVKVKAVDENGTAIENARVHVRAANGTGPFPFQESVTITRSASTATATHTAHGMDSNDKVLIVGADQPEYNGVHQITVIDANSYSYTVSGSPATPATGTITSTFVALDGLTNVSGEISTSRVYGSNQPVTGWSRKSTSSPFFKQGPINSTVSNTSGLDFTAVMVRDE